MIKKNYKPQIDHHYEMVHYSHDWIGIKATWYSEDSRHSIPEGTAEEWQSVLNLLKSKTNGRDYSYEPHPGEDFKRLAVEILDRDAALIWSPRNAGGGPWPASRDFFVIGRQTLIGFIQKALNKNKSNEPIEKV